LVFNDEKTKLDLLTDQIIKERGAGRPDAASISAENLPTLSNDQLRLKVTQFAEELSKFEARFQLANSQLEAEEGNQEAQIPRTNNDALQKRWVLNRAADEQRRNQHRAEYDVRFRSQAVSYKHEICKRMEFISPCPTKEAGAQMIDSGGVGALFVGEVAGYLTVIANDLPP
jgi:hypothetical protein